jgi:hypothetical protein
VQYIGTDHPDIGFDFTQTFGVQHTSTITYHHASRLLSEICDYQINAAVIKDHDDWAGVTLCMKNLYGSFDNIPITQMHYGGFNTGIPGLSQIVRDELDDRTRLFLIDGTFGFYDGGPGYVPPHHSPPNWAYNSLIVSLDRVAGDRIGTVKINEERAQHGLPPLDPGHVAAAAQPPYNLGTDNLEEIELVEIDASNTQAVAGGNIEPRSVALLPPYPNPARGGCTLRFRCAAPADAELVITDPAGAVVRHITSARYGSGSHRVQWNGRDERGLPVPSGTYFCCLRTAAGMQRQRIVWVR